MGLWEMSNTYDFGIFNALRKSIEENVVERVVPAPIPSGAVNENESYIAITVGDIQQTLGVQACSRVEIDISHLLEESKTSTRCVLEKIFMKSIPLFLGQVEIGKACFKATRREFLKEKIVLDAFIVFERIYRDEY